MTDQLQPGTKRPNTSNECVADSAAHEDAWRSFANTEPAPTHKDCFHAGWVAGKGYARAAPETPPASKEKVWTADIEACRAWLIQSRNSLAASHQMVAMLNELLERRRADETATGNETCAVDYVQFGWIPYHEKQGCDPGGIEEHEENQGELIEGWRYVPAYAAVQPPSQKARVVPSVCGKPMPHGKGAGQCINVPGHEGECDDMPF